MNNFDPTIDLANSIIGLGDSIDFSSVATVNDRDGDAIAAYRIFDPSGGGFFTLNGVEQSAGSYFDVDASDIGGLRYHASPTVGSESIRALVYDGGRWSPEVSATFYSVSAPTSRPVVTGQNKFNVVAYEKVLLSNYFSAEDPDGYPITKYKVKDNVSSNRGGYIEVNGKAINQNTWVTFDADQLDKVYYVGSTGQQTERVLVRAYDGSKWSKLARIQANTSRNANRPLVSTATFTVRSETSVPLIETFEVRDEDRSTMKSYRFLNTRLNGGYIEVNGKRQPSKKWITISAENMANARFIASDTAFEQDVRVRAYDGKFWSKIQTIEFESLPDPSLEVSDSRVLDEFEIVPITDIVVRQADQGPRITEYEFIDMNPARLSGYLELDGNKLQAGEIHKFNQQEFGRLNLIGGADNERSWDQIKVRANNGSGVNDFFVGEWKNINVFTEPNAFTSLIMPAADADELNSWLDYLSPSTNGRLQLTYSFVNQLGVYYTDGTIDPPDGWDEPSTNSPNTNANQRRSIRTAFGLYDELLDVDFTEVSDNYVDPLTGHAGGHFRFHTYFEDSPVSAFAYAPGDPGQMPWAADIWINVFYFDNFQSLGPDSQSFLTILHEMGHAMGLNHPHELEFGKTVLSNQIDHDGITVMSYAQNPNGTAARNLMLYDALWLQDVYGPNPNTRTGDDTYTWNDVRFQDLVYDVSGEDVIDASNQTRGVTINLQQGQSSSIGFVDDNVSIAFGTVIENAIGTARDDIFIGNEVVNKIWGGAGDDIFQGGGEDDFYYGGAGDDTYTYEPGDGHNTIDEEKSTGRDVIEVRNGNQFGLDSFTDDISFQRHGRDLLVEFKNRWR